ncbi:MAG: RNA methyltransferase [Prevotellaceae bacterium]|jgi:TrmH family RNA methyltransferase|nr:RNA methyltransferase [Prevotellaceae bacterium]
MQRETITSLQNAKIKNIVLLGEKSRERNKQMLFPVEGRREINMAVAEGYEIDSLFVCPDFADAPDFAANHIYNVNRKVFDKIAYRENSDGCLALMKMKSNSLNALTVSDNPFIIVIESVEKPGNLGAILRTADAANVDALIVCDPKCDIYNPNVIRSSLGCVFSVKTVTCSSETAFEWLKTNSVTVYAAELEASQWYCNEDYTASSAIVMGAESAGLSDFWLNNADRRIKIPMNGKVDSLNVSVSAAIITFEAVRQRLMQTANLVHADAPDFHR